MLSFRQFLAESEKLSDLTYLQVCNLVMQNNFLEIVDYDLQRITKSEALARPESIIFVKHFNPMNEDVSWYCCSHSGFNYSIPDDFVLDGYIRMTRDKCIQHGVDWIEVVGI